jgi:aspartate/tyrosine/aromatic aminotransferase
MPEGSFMLLQSCCHNPTGASLTRENWIELSSLMKQRKIIPFFDSAYQGFGEGFEEDVFPIRHFEEEGHEMIVAISFSKNFGLYGERVGMLALKLEEPELTAALFSHCKAVVRSQYSLPPCNGSRIIKEILADPLLEAQWRKELVSVRQRVCEMREGLARRLGKAYDFMLEQKGMFSYIGLNKNQVERLKKEYAIYIPASGRINVASLTEGTLDRVAQAIQAVQ